jgi:hypothetical protein
VSKKSRFYSIGLFLIYRYAKNTVYTEKICNFVPPARKNAVVTDNHSRHTLSYLRWNQVLHICLQGCKWCSDEDLLRMTWMSLRTSPDIEKQVNHLYIYIYIYIAWVIATWNWLFFFDDLMQGEWNMHTYQTCLLIIIKFLLTYTDQLSVIK